jgi:cytochrome c peroxidase
MRKILFIALPIAAAIYFASGCKPDDTPNPTDELIGGTYAPQPFSLNIPSWMPQPVIPEDNPLTVDGIELGRRLFYDPILSSDSTQSCASCHRQELAFTDGLAVSTGVLGISGRRSAMALDNLAFHVREFFWDGRSNSLEAQALIPVEDHTEMNESWPNVLDKLRRHPDYPKRFRQAFGIARKSEITKELAAKAIAQFERTLISANSRYDDVIWRNQGWYTDEEERGRQLFFFEESQALNHPGCSHCHFAPTFGNNSFNTYTNNGLDNVPNIDAFPDKGRGEVTGNRFDNGKFRVVSLHNIELTAPYMHDGRFQTLEEVLDHYTRGGHGVENEDVNILPFTLSARDKQDLIAFLKTLTDPVFINNPAHSNPFQ